MTVTSTDGKSLAVSGFHEVLILEVASQPAGAVAQFKTTISKRLIGVSSRIESVKFSPDGSRLAVAGGNPGEMGEIQIWDVNSATLQLSKIVGKPTAVALKQLTRELCANARAAHCHHDGNRCGHLGLISGQGWKIAD